MALNSRAPGATSSCWYSAARDLAGVSCGCDRPGGKGLGLYLAAYHDASVQLESREREQGDVDVAVGQEAHHAFDAGVAR